MSNSEQTSDYYKNLDGFQGTVGRVSFTRVNYLSCAEWRTSVQITGWQASCVFQTMTVEGQVRNSQEDAFYSLVDVLIKEQTSTVKSESLLLEKMSKFVKESK